MSDYLGLCWYVPTWTKMGNNVINPFHLQFFASIYGFI